MALVILEGLVEDLGAARFLAFELLDSCTDVLDDGRLLMLLITDDGLQPGVDLKGRFTARAAHLNELTFAFCH